MLTNKLFTVYKNQTGLGTKDSMALERKWDDMLVCEKHSHYQLYHNGLPVEGSEYREHYNPQTDVLSLSNGRFVENLNLSNQPDVSENDALATVLNEINATLYAWEDDSTEYFLQLDSIPGLTTYYPTGKLVYTLSDTGNFFNPNAYLLAWKFSIVALTPHLNSTAYVNAITGELIRIVSNIKGGDCNHIYYGNKYIDTDWKGFPSSKYFLYANDGHNFFTKDGGTIYDYWNFSDLPKDNDDQWGNDHWGATSTHYVVQNVWDYFKNAYGRNGVNGNNKLLRVVGNKQNPDGTFYVYGNTNYDYIVTDKRNNNLEATYDIVGHEFAHGVVRHTANFKDENEQSSINESFADIFGLLAERYGNGGSYNWTIGETSELIRTLDQPSTQFDGHVNQYYPDYYLQPNNWHMGSTNYHHNSTLHGRFFYLLSIGGTQLSKSVSGIGIDKAANIVYTALQNYCLSSDTWVSIRNWEFIAARRLYGECSNEELQTCRAWSACNIGPYCEPCALVSRECYSNCNISLREPTGFENISGSPKKLEITLYPNPTFNVLNFKVFNYSVESELTFEITDLLGRVYLVGNALGVNSFEQIGISSLTSGIYLINFADNKGNRLSLKFIKQ